MVIVGQSVLEHLFHVFVKLANIAIDAVEEFVSDCLQIDRFAYFLLIVTQPGVIRVDRILEEVSEAMILNRVPEIQASFQGRRHIVQCCHFLLSIHYIFSFLCCTSFWKRLIAKLIIFLFHVLTLCFHDFNIRQIKCSSIYTSAL